MKKLLLLAAFVVSLGLRAQTWADDVACIVYSHCTGCHNPKGSAPFSLLSYDTAVIFASSIKAAVSSGEMPPWPVNNNYRKMAHDRSLSEHEKSTILDWINKGTPSGNMSNAPAAPVYTTSLKIPNPDLKLQIPTFTVPSITQDLYRCFVLPTGVSVQKFVTGIEIIPGNHSIVHHAQVFYDTTGVTATLDAADPDPGYTSVGGVGTNAAVLLGTWVPGADPIFVPAGMGKRLPPGATIVMQIHYPEYASFQTDSTKVHFLFTNNPVRNISDAPVLNHNQSMIDGPLFIPKNTVKTFHQKLLVPMNATILSIGPHGHLLCKSLKAFGVTLGGDTIPLVDIPEWNFHWQGSYDFQKPIKIPIGTTLYSVGVYDNTTNNPENPSDPPKDVSVGEATTDEMMLFYFSYLPYVSGDEKIVIDTFHHKPHYNNCISRYAGINDVTRSDLSFAYPNPAGDRLNLMLPEGTTIIELVNAMGQVVIRAGASNTIDISTLSAGVYTVRLLGERSISTRIVKQ